MKRSRVRVAFFSTYLLALGSVIGAVVATCCAGFVPGVLKYWGLDTPEAKRAGVLVTVILGALAGAYVASLSTAELRRKAALREEQQPEPPGPIEDTRPDWLKEDEE